MEKTIKWGIIGPGGIADKFCEGLKAVPGSELIAVGSRSKERAVEFASKYNIGKAYGSYSELAADPEIDVIYIATPHVFHCENTLMCLENGKAVLCEKPFAINEKEVLKMILKAREKNIFLMEALWSRFLPTIIKTKELIESGAIGEVVHLKSDFGFKAPYDPNKRLFNHELGGGCLLDIGIYPAFLSLLLLGEPTDIKAEAAIGATGVDENLSVIFKYPHGKLASFCCTFMADMVTETHIYGTKGYIRLNRMWFMPNPLTLITNDGKEKTIDFDSVSNGYNYEAVEVTKCLLNGEKESSLMPLDFSISLIRLLDKIRNICGIKYAADKN